MNSFAGRQDAMQRQSLVPISEFMKENGSINGAGFELLDLATGTGRYATFVKVCKYHTQSPQNFHHIKKSVLTSLGKKGARTSKLMFASDCYC